MICFVSIWANNISSGDPKPAQTAIHQAFGSTSRPESARKPADSGTYLRLTLLRKKEKRMQLNTNRSHQELQNESKTLWYEFSQLRKVADRLRVDAFRDDASMHNALVESFAIHFRAICCFFFAHHNRFPNPRSDDLIAELYAPDWRINCPEPSEFLIEAKQACDKQVAHITAVRRDLNFAHGYEHKWLVCQIEQELRNLLHRFLECAITGYFDPKALAGLTELTLEPLAKVTSSHQSSISMTAKTCPPFDEEPPVRASSFGGLTDQQNDAWGKETGPD
jgi:hypothetical protein